MDLLISDELVDKHLDAVLRASGSALRHYSMPSTISAMRQAMRQAISDCPQPTLSQPEPNCPKSSFDPYDTIEQQEFIQKGK